VSARKTRTTIDATGTLSREWRRRRRKMISWAREDRNRFLVALEGSQEPSGAYEAIALRFEDGRSCIYGVDNDSDEIIKVAEPTSELVTISLTGAGEPQRWLVIWAWILENQRGYRDALQFEVRNDDGRTLTFQLMAAASALRPYLVSAYDW